MNIVHGLGSEAGSALVRHPDVPTISFTGGTTTGRDIAVSCAKQFKRTSLELGGKNPFVVFADADVDRAASEAARAAFSNSGQICLCGSRILVESSVLPEFQEKLLAATAAMQLVTPLKRPPRLVHWFRVPLPQGQEPLKRPPGRCYAVAGGRMISRSLPRRLVPRADDLDELARILRARGRGSFCRWPAYERSRMNRSPSFGECHALRIGRKRLDQGSRPGPPFGAAG